MKKTKRGLAMFLCALLLFSVTALPTQAAEAGAEQSGAVELLFYIEAGDHHLFDRMTAIAEIRNQTPFALKDVRVECVSPQFCFRGATDASCTLAAGESREFAFQIQTSMNIQGELSFFTRLLLGLRNLLTGAKPHGGNTTVLPPSYKNRASLTLELNETGTDGEQPWGWLACYLDYEPVITELESTAQIVSLYNMALDSGLRNSMTQTMTLVDGSLKGDGLTGAFLSVLEPAAKRVLADNSFTDDELVAVGGLLVSDVISATSSSADGKITLDLTLADEVNDADGNPKGAVSRGIGTLGSIEYAVSELGATITDGAETITVTYSNPTVHVVIDEATMQIIGGQLSSLATVRIGDVSVEIGGISAHLQNAEGQIAYTETIN